MSSFEFDTINEFNSSEILMDGFYLWIWYADKMPPHIGCSSNGSYFSLKVNGKDQDIKVKKVLSLIEKKKIPTILVKIKNVYSQESVFQKYAAFQKAETGKNTCLTPIIELFNCQETVFQLSDLLVFLNRNKDIESVFGLNLKNDYKGIADYSNTDIENRLRKLEHAKSQKHIPSVG